MSNDATHEHGMNRHQNRRRFLQYAAAVSAAGGTFLTACGGTTPLDKPTSPAPDTACTLPPPPSATGSEVLVKSKMPGVVPDAYTGLPKSYATTCAPPGRGGTVKAFMVTHNAQPAPKSENRYWQELDKRLGVKYEVTLAPADTYAEKLSTLVAGGDFPDLMWLDLAIATNQYKLIQQGAYTDLTPYLTGEALKEYPNLARYPAQVWKNVAIKGKIYGVPRLSFPNGGQTIRKDWVDKVGGNINPKNADELYQLLKDLTTKDPDGDGQANTWGIGGQGTIIPQDTLFMSMFRVPNQWRKKSNGSLTYYIETPEYKEALAYMRKLFADGIFYPDTLTQNYQQNRDNFIGGKFALASSAMGPRGESALMKTANPKADPVFFTPPGHDGGKTNYWETSGFYGFVAIPSKIGKDSQRVRDLLHILNFFAAPLGSDEYTFLNFGIDGVHSEKKSETSRVRTDQWSKDILDLKNLLGVPLDLYFPGTEQDAVKLQDYYYGRYEVGVRNAALGGYSETWTTSGNVLNQLVLDRVIRILSGRDPVSAVDSLVSEWKQRGGTTVAKEYADSLK